MKKTGHRSFIIARRISKRMFRLYCTLYILTLCLIVFTILPWMFYLSYNNCRNTITDTATNFADMQSQITSAAANLMYSDIIDSMLFSTEYSDPQQKKARIELELDAFIDRNPSVLAISLVTASGESYYPISSYKYDLAALLNSDPDYVELRNRNHSSYFGPLVTDVFDRTGMQYKAFSYSITTSSGANRYTLTIFYNVNAYMNVTDRFISRSLNELTVLDRSGQCMTSTADPETVEELEKLDFYKIHISGTRPTLTGIYFYASVTSSGWKVIGFASYALLLKNAIIIILAITLLSAVAPFTFVRFLDRAVTDELTPIRTLSDMMANFRIGQTARTSIQSHDEIQDMCNSFNSMIDTIDCQASEIREQEKKNAVVSYKLLVTQIDPHFIYNTMNIINIMARNGDDNSIVEVNSALIKILRERLSVKLSVLNTIEEEINTLEQYNLIMRYRFGDRIHTYVSVSPELLNVKIPKNILQPLVENAFYHGFDADNSERQLDVDIMVYSQGDDIVIEISDNGKGMTLESLNAVRENSTDLYRDEKPHIGIDNVRQRIAFLYNDRARLEISSEVNSGTNIVITLPLQTDRDADFK